MAAFIQKLFGNRKATATAVTPRKEATKEEADKTSRQDDQRELQAEALKANPSEGELEVLAIGGLTAGIRSEAAEALTEKATLQRVQKLAKGKDKGVYQIVRQKLQRIRDDEDRQRKLAETIQTIVRHAVEQARSDDTKLFEARDRKSVV